MFVLNIEIERDWRAKRYLIFPRHWGLNIYCTTVHQLQEALTTQNMLGRHEQYSWGLQPPIGEKYSGPMCLLKKDKTYGLWSGNCHTVPVVGALVPMSLTEQGQVIGPGYLLFEGPHAQISTSGKASESVRKDIWTYSIPQDSCNVSTPFGPYPKFVNLSHPFPLVTVWFNKPFPMSFLIWSVGLFSWIACLTVFGGHTSPLRSCSTQYRSLHSLCNFKIVSVSTLYWKKKRSRAKYSSMVCIHFLPDSNHSLYLIYGISLNVIRKRVQSLCVLYLLWRCTRNYSYPLKAFY